MGSLKHHVQANRDLFPRRKRKHAEVRNDGKREQIKLTLSRFLFKTIKDRAKKNGTSMNMVVEEALRKGLFRQFNDRPRADEVHSERARSEEA